MASSRPSRSSRSSPTTCSCGHGATVTEIDRSHLFYLMARGIDEKTARGMLVKAFVAEVIEELDDEAMVEALEVAARRLVCRARLKPRERRRDLQPGGRVTEWTKQPKSCPTTSRRSAATSRSCRARSTASRWSISTMARRRKSRRRCSTRSSTPIAANTPMSIAGCTSSPTRRPTPMRRRARSVRRFLNAGSTEEIVFTSNTTSAINTVAYGFGMPQHRRGRRDRAVDHGAPFQHRALAFHPRAAGGQAGLGAGR